MDITNISPTTNALHELIEIISHLRSPIEGCPWDLEQTHRSLIPFLLEEAHEVADAIRFGNDHELQEELGDLLLQVVLHAQIAKEENRFNLEDIAINLNKKLIRRHPHVFAGQKVKTSAEVNQNWEEIKISEKPTSKSKSPLSDYLRNKVRSQSALVGATYISKKAAKGGFEWKNIEEVWSKVNEEMQELKEAIDKKDFLNAQEELGDLLFTLINLARWCKISPEEGLAGTNNRFLDRFSYIESTLDGNLSKSSSKELKRLWEIAKRDFQDKKVI